jgi:hypothetical protein
MLNSIFLAQIYYIFRNQNTKKINLINENVVIIVRNLTSKHDSQSFIENTTETLQNVR